MSSIFFISNQRAGELFRANGYEVEDKDLRPVMISRMFQKTKQEERWHTDMRFPCWKIKNRRDILLRVDNGELISNPVFSSCQQWRLYEGFILEDGTYLNLGYFSLAENRIELTVGKYAKCLYRQVIFPK